MFFHATYESRTVKPCVTITGEQNFVRKYIRIFEPASERSAPGIGELLKKACLITYRY